MHMPSLSSKDNNKLKDLEKKVGEFDQLLGKLFK